MNELIQKKIPLPTWVEPENIDEAQIRILDLAKNIHEFAYLIGKDLIWVKKKEKGNFLNWIENNLWFGERTAEYMMASAIRCDDSGKLLSYHGWRSETKSAPGAVFIPGTYKTIVIDPPWPIEKIERYERPHQLNIIPENLFQNLSP